LKDGDARKEQFSRLLETDHAGLISPVKKAFLGEVVSYRDAVIVLPTESDEQTQIYETRDHLSISHALAATRNWSAWYNCGRSLRLVYLVNGLE
jgi:hypothetical protein